MNFWVVGNIIHFRHCNHFIYFIFFHSCCPGCVTVCARSYGGHDIHEETVGAWGPASVLWQACGQQWSELAVWSAAYCDRGEAGRGYGWNVLASENRWRDCKSYLVDRVTAFNILPFLLLFSSPPPPPITTTTVAATPPAITTSISATATNYCYFHHYYHHDPLLLLLILLSSATSASLPLLVY